MECCTSPMGASLRPSGRTGSQWGLAAVDNTPFTTAWNTRRVAGTTATVETEGFTRRSVTASSLQVTTAYRFAISNFSAYRGSSSII